MTAAKCDHAASGCNYPEGECAGFCKPITRAWEIQRERVNISLRFPAYPEMQGRLSFHLYSGTYESTLHEYFDNPQSLEDLADLLRGVAQIMRADQTPLLNKACPPCNHNCNQGRDCPARRC